MTQRVGKWRVDRNLRGYNGRHIESFEKSVKFKAVGFYMQKYWRAIEEWNGIELIPGLTEVTDLFDSRKNARWKDTGWMKVDKIGCATEETDSWLLWINAFRDFWKIRKRVGTVSCEGQLSR
jgi:hypothetical protein